MQNTLPQSLPFFNQEAWITDLPDVEYKLALDCLSHHDVGHALFHLGQALAKDPCEPTYLQLAERIAGEAQDVLHHEQLQVNYVGIQYLRAILLASRGLFNEAMRLSVSCAELVGDHRYLDVVRTWLGHTQTFSLAPFSELAGWLMSKDNLVKAVSDWLPVLDDVFARVGITDELFCFRYITVKRVAGFRHEAVQMAEQLVATLPGYWSYLAAANSHFALQHSEASFYYLEQAALINPNDEAVRLDLGDRYSTAGMYSQSEAAYADAIRINPESDWARSSIAHVRLLMGGKIEWLRELQAIAHGGSERAQHLLRYAWSYFDYLPEPLDAYVELAQQVLETGDNLSGEVYLGAGMPPCPSAQIAVQRHVERYFPTARVRWEMTADTDQTMKEVGLCVADFQKAITAVRYALWSFDNAGEQPVVSPRYDERNAEIYAKVHELATTQYNLPEWWQTAQRLAELLPKTAVVREQLLTCMCNPPESPPQTPAWTWIYGWQIACALMIASLETTWKDSKRKQILSDLVCGAPDWSGAAASVVLTAIYHNQTDLSESERAEVGADLDALFTQATDKAHVFSPTCYAVTCCHITLRGLSAEVQDSLYEAKYAFENYRRYR